MDEIIYHCYELDTMVGFDNNVESIIYLYIDNEIDDPSQAKALEFHFEVCPPCNNQVQIERKAIEQIKGMLTHACNEQAPENLRVSILNSLNDMTTGPQIQSSFFSTTFQQITQTTDGFSQTIETSFEFRSEGFTFPFMINDDSDEE